MHLRAASPATRWPGEHRGARPRAGRPEVSAAQGGAAHPQPPVGAGAPAPRKRPPRQVAGVVDSGAMAQTRVSARTTASWLAAPPSAPRCPRTAGRGLQASRVTRPWLRWRPLAGSVGLRAELTRPPSFVASGPLLTRRPLGSHLARPSSRPALGRKASGDPSAASLGCKTDKGPWRSFSCDEIALGLSREPRLLRRDLSDFACH